MQHEHNLLSNIDGETRTRPCRSNPLQRLTDMGSLFGEFVCAGDAEDVQKLIEASGYLPLNRLSRARSPNREPWSFQRHPMLSSRSCCPSPTSATAASRRQSGGECSPDARALLHERG
jgi:hypothetical protein